MGTSATMQLIELAERLNASGEIGDGMVAQFHELAAMARFEQEGCTHDGPLKPGPRIPLRWGSAATLICRRCGMWRQERTPTGPWQSPAALQEALDAEEPA